MALTPYPTTFSFEAATYLAAAGRLLFTNQAASIDKPKTIHAALEMLTYGAGQAFPDPAPILASAPAMTWGDFADHMDALAGKRAAFPKIPWAQLLQAALAMLLFLFGKTPAPPAP